MKGKPIQNLAASVYARLLKRTEPGDEQFQFVLMRYGAERLMYRLSQSEYAANFVPVGVAIEDDAAATILHDGHGLRGWMPGRCKRS